MGCCVCQQVQGRRLDAFCWCIIDLNWKTINVPIVCGDNEIGIRLISTEDERGGLVEVSELEVYVYVRS